MSLLFGQQNAYSAPWFAARFGQHHSIPLSGFPHVAALLGDHATYLDYLAESWRMIPRRNTAERRARWLSRLLRPPRSTDLISTLTRPNGDQLIVDGNHRAAWAYVRGEAIQTLEADLDAWLAKTVSNPERYGAPKGIPYQSLGPWLAGRRPDTGTRHVRLDWDDLTGRVLDLGCNIGAETMLAAVTADQALGVDVSPRLVTAAARLGTYLASPAQFRVADLATEVIEGWDTVLCFSILAHVKPWDALRRTLTSARVVYIEENGGTDLFPRVRGWFRHVDEIERSARPLWRCEP
jgi:SAM-dependent methyltransferase